MGRDNQSHQSWLRHHIDSLKEHIDNFGQILSTLSNELEVAKDSQHLNSKEEIKLGHGPSENRWRPSIDLLFRSAAAHFSTRVIGGALTGLLNDGTSGMGSIKWSGGMTIVQDPKEEGYKVVRP